MSPKKTDFSKTINKVPSTLIPAKQQCKERLKKRIIKLSKNLDIFMTITEKDRLDSTAF